MLLTFLRWWTGRLSELLPFAMTRRQQSLSKAIIVSRDAQGELAARLRRRGAGMDLPLSLAARIARRRPVILAAPANSVLVKWHALPTLPAREMRSALRHELSRLSPFKADELYWHFSVQAQSPRRERADIALTMVPKIAVEAALAELKNLGLPVDFIETHAFGSTQLHAVDANRLSGPRRCTRALAGAAMGLLFIAMTLPLLRQFYALQQVEAEIARLQPASTEAEKLRRELAEGSAWRAIWQQETARVGDVASHLATLTWLLPDDAFLTNFAIRERQLMLNGQTSSAAHLITVLSADPAIRDASFAAPVLHAPSTSSDIFMIRATLVR